MTLKNWQEEILKRENINDSIKFNNNNVCVHRKTRVQGIQGSKTKS